ncbi:hypothetical protein BaRGS_00029810 [Batillaria attramentaria]|uniref:EF-hand domain-containing protein n=1 Tax=Batillaria attramentaria TaxID=370345 RepID=A0ABD0JVP3_9CAEN
MAHRKKFVNPHKFERRVAGLSRDSKLSKDLVKQLMHYFNSITINPPGKMNRNMFRMEFTMRFNLMDEFTLDNLYRCFDFKNRGAIMQEDYIRGMGSFLSDDLDTQTRLAFNVSTEVDKNILVHF